MLTSFPVSYSTQICIYNVVYVINSLTNLDAIMYVLLIPPLKSLMSFFSFVFYTKENKLFDECFARAIVWLKFLNAFLKEIISTVHLFRDLSVIIIIVNYSTVFTLIYNYTF